MLSVEDLILIVICISIGFIGDKLKPQEYHYGNNIVIVYKKYQCPIYCALDHFHYVYFDSTLIEPGGMYIDKDKLGEKYKGGKNEKRKTESLCD